MTNGATARMTIHPDLWPAIAAAIIGAPLLVWLAIWYRRRFRSLSTRRRVTFGLAVLVLHAGYWLGLYAFFVEPKTLIVREEAVHSEQWTGAPLRIALIADPHIGGAHVNAARMERIVARVNANAPDIVFLLGDYIDGHESVHDRSAKANADIAAGLAAFAALEAPAFAVIGNHDVWFGDDAVERALQQAGVTVLWNDHALFTRDNGEMIQIVGLEDNDTMNPDYKDAFAGAGLETALIISHSPDPFATMPASVAARTAAMFAGHTHCGQVRLPFVPMRLPSRYGERFACGLINENGRQLYVAGGIGTSVLPLRFRSPPELVFVTLRSDADEPVLAAN